MTPNWVPFNISWTDHVPVDISFVFEREKPAGKHGFLKVKGDRFVFEDGTEGRFWGTCFNSGANFPPKAYSEMVARRLAKFGLNMMRTHQMDAEWATPNIFQYNRAKPKDNTRTFDPESIDALDYLIYCLKQEGVYIYLDLLTYRQFRPGDEVDAVDQLGQAAKPYLYFDRRLIELQKEFNRDLWTHTNPYTKLAYKDDPAIALTELVNESDPFVNLPVLEPYRSRLEQQYRQWADQSKLLVEADTVDFAHPTPQVARFLVQVMKDYYREMIAHLRSIGVKIPVNGTNWSINLGISEAQTAADFSDSHVYWNFPLWESSGTSTKPMVGSFENGFAYLSLMRHADRPFFVSEWDHAWPDEWRAESPVAYAAVAALQGWSGMTIHTYRYSTWEPEDRLGGGGSTINSITYRNHFDAYNDPAKFGLFPAAALILRRGDVKPANKLVTVEIPSGGEWSLKTITDLPALKGMPELHRVGLVFPGESRPVQADQVLSPDQQLLKEETGQIISDTGEMGRSWSKRWGWIDTPRTKAVFGFLAEAGKIALKGLELEVTTDFATIVFNSLTDDPLDQADTILLTAVGRADNSDAQYDAEHTKQFSFGRPPILIEPIEAKIRLKTGRSNLKVLVISEHAELVTKLPVQYQDGVLSFEIGPQPSWNPSTMYYLIKI